MTSPIADRVDVACARARAQLALDTYPEDDRETLVIDLLTDLRHLCADRGMNFGQALAMSEQHYESERKEAASC